MARIQVVKSGFWERFKGSIDVGAGYTSATELLQLDLDAEAALPAAEVRGHGHAPTRC